MQKGKFRRVLAVLLSLAMISGMVFTGGPTFAVEANGEYDEVQQESSASTTTTESAEPEGEGEEPAEEPQETEEKGGPSTRSIIPPTTPTHTYIFKVDGAELERQIVKNGESLIEPQAPVKEGYKFTGWYVGEDKIDFSQPVSVGETSEEITANARFEEVHYVFFMDGTGANARVFQTKEGIDGDVVSTTDVKLPLGSTQAVTGWYLNQELSGTPVGDTYTIGTANQQLWPNIETGHYVYFVSGENASYVEPQFVAPGGTTSAPTSPPTRPGYAFSHWSDTPGGGAYSFGSGISEDITLYAVWTPNSNTEYTVVFWKQSVHDDKNAADADKTYDYAESEVRTAATGATVSPTTADQNKNYQGFHYNSGKSVGVVVKGDGTTILNVYYDRNLLTIDFHRNGHSGAEDGEYTGLYGQTLAQNGYTWPSNYKWTASWNGGNTLTFLDAFIFDNLPAYGSTTYINVYAQSLSGSAQIVHYKEALDGSWVEANRTRTSGGTFNFSNKYTGFTVYQYRADNGTWRSASPGGSAGYTYLLEIRHKRNSYKLAFYNYNVTSREETVLFEGPLSGYSDYTPPKPAGLPEEYVFQGWYKDEAFSEPFVFASETMPSNDLMIYAKWAPPVVNGTFHVQFDGTGEPKTVELPYNEAIDPAIMPTVKDHLGNVISQGDDNYIVTVPENHKWIGWSTKVVDDYITWNFNTKVLSDIELFPYYVNNAQFTVTYHAGGGEGEPPTDPQKYAQNSYADVKAPTGLTPPVGKVFLGWDCGGVMYQPGDKIKVTGDLTLTAQWGDTAQPIELTYHYNYGESAPTQAFSYPVNSIVTVKALSDMEWTAPANYKFAGWNTEADGTGTLYQPDASVMVDANGENHLYAMWTPVLTVTSGTQSWPYDGDSHTYQQYTLVYGDQTIVGDEGVTTFTLNDDKTVTITPTGKGASGVKDLSDNSDNNNTFSVEAEGVEQGTHVFGTLTITALTDKVTVTITENSGTEKYDGSEKTVTGYTVAISNLLYTVDDFTFSGDATVKGTNAGTYNMELKPEDFTNNNTNFTNVEFVIVDGTLEITKRAVTLTSATDSKVYDGTALTNDEVTVGGDGFADGEGASYDVTGTQTEVGNSPNAFTYTLNEGTLAANYDITKVEGTLTVTALTDKVTVTITENSGTEKYDGSEKTVTGYTVAISNPLYTEADFTFSGDATVSGTNAGTYNMELKPEDFTNNNTNFTNVEFVIVDGTLEITKRAVTLTSATDTKVYDGTPLTNDTVTVTGDGFATGEGATYDVTGTQTAVGASNNTFTYTLNDGTLAGNYEITKVEGTLTVTALTDKVTVTITENSGTEKYDGSEKTVTGYTVAISNPLYKEADFTFSGDATVKGTNAGTYDMELKPEDFTNNNTNFTNVEFVIVDGTLEITKRAVTLTSATDTKVYDGTALTNDTVTVTGDGFADGEGATYDVTGTRTNVGTSNNVFTYTLNDGTLAANYDITKVEGTLTVTPVTEKVIVTITENSGTEKYDGSEKTVTGYTVAISNPLYTEDDFTFSGDATVKGTNAGTYPMELKPEDFTNNSANFANVEFVIVDGTLTITKRAVTLTSASDIKVYDGTALTNDTVTVTGDGFAEGEGATYDVTGSQTAVGSSNNTFTYTLNDGTLAANYDITKVEGTLTVTALTDKVTVTITENSGTEKYDGSEKTVTGYTVAISNPLYTVDDFTFSGDATVKGINAGTYNMELKPEDFANNSANFTDVEFVIVDGTLTITKRAVTLTSATDTKVYDGTPLTNDTVTVTGDGFADGEGATYDVTGTRTNVGSSINAFTYTLNDGTLAANYDITKVEGTLTVTALTDKVTVTITENSGTEKYDGSEKTVTGYTVAISNPLYTVDDFTFSGDATVKGTNAGTYDMELKPEDFTNTNTNFTNVEFVIVDGTLEITKRAVTLTSATDSKVYDGTALTNDEVTVGGDGFADGEGASYDVTGTQTEVGNSPNAFTYTLNEGTLAANYDITKTEGTLTVTALTEKVTVTITENSGTEKYDGSEKTVTGYTVTSISNPLYTEADFTFSGDATVKGTNAGTYDMELKPEDFTNNNTNFTNVEFVIVDGTLTITKRAVTLTSATDTKVYDGTPLTNDTVTVTGDGFATGEGAAYDVTGSQTNVGTSNNTFTYTLNEGTLAANYDITKVEGTLTVTALTDKVTVTITENSGTEKYDGSEKTVTGYTVAISNPLYTEADFTFSGDATVKGTNAGTYNMELKPEDFTNNSANFTNVEFVIVDGTLTITKRAVTLTSATDSKVYDGTALTNGEVTVGGDGFAEGEGATYDVTGSQTDVGTSNNTFTYTLNDGTLADNYDITTFEGTLTVTAFTDKVIVTITENSGTELYDGTEKTVTGYTVAISNPLYTEADFMFRYRGPAIVRGTNAGTYNMELLPEDFWNISENFTNVEFVIIDGTLTINKRTVTLTSGDGTKVYDGTPLTNDEVTVGGDGWADGEGASFDVTGSQTDVGTSNNTFAYTLNEGMLAENYDIEVVEGTLTVTPVTEKVVVMITENSGTEKYDGSEKTVTGYTVAISNPLYTEDDFTFSGDATAKGINAGTYNMELKPEDFTNNSANFEDVEFVIVDGTLEITKRQVTLTSATDSKVYDGTALTNHNVAVSGDGFADGEGAAYDVTGTQTAVGMSSNAFTYTLNEDTLADNYDITTVEGTLTVTETPKTSVVVTKVWDDENNKDGSRPKSITVKLLADGVDIGMVLELTAEKGWTGAFTDLEEYKDGKKIVYTVAENEIKGYTALIVEDKAGKGFIITNTHKPVAPPPTTGENISSYPLMGLMFIAFGALLLIKRRKRVIG